MTKWVMLYDDDTTVVTMSGILIHESQFGSFDIALYTRRAGRNRLLYIGLQLCLAHDAAFHEASVHKPFRHISTHTIKLGRAARLVMIIRTAHPSKLHI